MDYDCVYKFSFVLLMRCFFFFKQKTAYEVRISDWSSDVCSSDLQPVRQPFGRHMGAVRCGKGVVHIEIAQSRHRIGKRGVVLFLALFKAGVLKDGDIAGRKHRDRPLGVRPMTVADRSEEHTSELQSLMRISYAVFCLKKKKY